MPMNFNHLDIKVTVEKQYLRVRIYIDHEEIPYGVGSLFDFFADLLNNGINLPWHHRHESRNFYFNRKISIFEPFTCSCGISGCIGIYNGIMTKYRRYTIEWRTNEEDGYKPAIFKRYYCFEKAQYIHAIYKSYLQLKSLANHQIVIDDYTEEEQTVKEEYMTNDIWKQISQYFGEPT